ncbi:recombination-associated protein RdgC [Betaproteobacteria bacterium]|nr:recombination-associated protein RdgC [Betaproteobacteria bacterium]
MWFRNLQFYRLPAPWQLSADELEALLAKHPFQHCGSQNMESRGWVSPLGNDILAHTVGGQWLIALGIETRLLPTAVVKQEADERAILLEEQQGYRPGRKQMKDLREQITQELLPRAFTRRRRTLAWIDPVNGWLGIDAASPGRAEDVLEHLRKTLDHFPLALVHVQRSPAAVMADWLAEGAAPAGFTLDQDCELRSVNEDRAAVRYVHHPLEGEKLTAEVRGHLEAGKLPTRLALTFDDRLSFILTDKLELKRLDFLDVIHDQIDGNDDDAEALFNAEFALMAGELARLLPALLDVLGGEQEQGLSTAAPGAPGDAPF